MTEQTTPATQPANSVEPGYPYDVFVRYISVRNVAHAVQENHFTVAVLTPAYPASSWTDFEGFLGDRLNRTLTLLLQPCQLSYDLAVTEFKFVGNRSEADREQEIGRLVKTIRGPGGKAEAVEASPVGK